jgi:RNA polymerase sigma-70 factor (ECF subfamily)
VVCADNAAQREGSQNAQESDEELRALMSSYRAGSMEAFQAIYVRFAPHLGRYLRQLARVDDASDLLQEAFLQIHRSRGTYNPAYPVRPWMFGIARNVFLMHRRSRRRWLVIHDLQSDPPEVAIPAEAEQLGSAEEIGRGMATLKAERAEALLLHHEWGFSFGEIAGMVGVSEGAARARASRGMADLRRAIREERGRGH